MSQIEKRVMLQHLVSGCKYDAESWNQKQQTANNILYLPYLNILRWHIIIFFQLAKKYS
jgi:hypothetical protein